VARKGPNFQNYEGRDWEKQDFLFLTDLKTKRATLNIHWRNHKPNCWTNAMTYSTDAQQNKAPPSQKMPNSKTLPTKQNKSSPNSKTISKNSTTETQLQSEDSLASTNAPMPNNEANNALMFQYAPKSLHPYIQLGRYDRPIGTYLLLFPTLWSAALAHGAINSGVVPVELSLLFYIGALVMRGAGCTVNDLWDKEMDKKVERTRIRPLASGVVTVPQAMSFVVFQSLIGAAVLFQLNSVAILAGVASLGLVATYPLMKRVTYWPQLFLGLTFNWGAIVGWAAVSGSLSLPVVLPLYVSGIAWTMIYDTIYAHQDKADDVKAGVKSTALLFGDRTRTILLGFLVVFFVGLMITGYNVKYHNLSLSYPYYLSVILATSDLYRQIQYTNLNSMKECGRAFRSNKRVGLMIWIGIIVSNYLYQDEGVERTSARFAQDD